MDTPPCQVCGRYHEPDLCTQDTKNGIDKSLERERQLPNFEFDKKTGVTALEMRLIEEADTKTIAELNKLIVPNLFKKSAETAAIRSEDIFFLLQCLHDGYIPTKKHLLREKWYGEHDPDTIFYTSFNPESPAIKRKHPDIKPNKNTFKGVVLQNVRLYSADIARTQAVYRNIWPYIISLEEFILDVQKKYSDGDPDDPMFWEEFFLNFISDLKNREALLLLWKHLDKSKISLDGLDGFIKLLDKRGGVIFGINNTAIEKFESYHGDLTDGDQNELVIQVPDMKFPTNFLNAIEPLGEFEDWVLEKLQTKIKSK